MIKEKIIRSTMQGGDFEVRKILPCISFWFFIIDYFIWNW